MYLLIVEVSKPAHYGMAHSDAEQCGTHTPEFASTDPYRRFTKAGYAMTEPNTNPLSESRVAHMAVGVMQSLDPRSPGEMGTEATSLGEVLLAQDAKADASVPTPEVDRVQEEVMAARSPEGRPPHRRTRLAEWKWFIVASVVLALSALIWGALSVVAWQIVAVAAALMLLFLGATSPVWGAGLLRGGEEREARKTALIHTQGSGPI